MKDTTKKKPHVKDTTKKKPHKSVFKKAPRPPKKMIQEMMKSMSKNAGVTRAREDIEMRDGFSQTCKYKVIEVKDPVYVVEIE